MDKITLINKSLWCFWYGLLGLIPVLGVPFGLMAIWSSWQLRRSPLAGWNPGRNYVTWGKVLAIIGLLFSFCCLSALAVRISKLVEY